MARVSETPAIELRGVSKIFTLENGENVTALDDVDLEVTSGEFICVLGPSGHGKSTMLNVIAGLTEPSEGEVLTVGVPVTEPGPDRGVVFQRDTLFPWRSVADNIGFGPRARGVPKSERAEIVQRYLKVIGMEQYGDAWPKQLSGGMRRRAAIAAVFANEPGVLLMDEPFVGLDYVRRATLHQVLLDLWKRSQSTVFFITHDVDEALALADRIVIVLNGRVSFETRIALDRPRGVDDLSGPEINEIRREILHHLNIGATA